MRESFLGEHFRIWMNVIAVTMCFKDGQQCIYKEKQNHLVCLFLKLTENHKGIIMVYSKKKKKKTEGRKENETSHQWPFRGAWRDEFIKQGSLRSWIVSRLFMGCVSFVFWRIIMRILVKKQWCLKGLSHQMLWGWFYS